MTSEQLLDFLKLEIQEMEKYKWCLGVQIGHDPLNDRSIEEIYCEWINKNGEQFRKKHEIKE
jgi:hypothetical protein